MPRLGKRALNRALLSRQYLLRRSKVDALAMIEHLVGVQAQNPHAPYVGLWTRLHGFRHHDLADLIIDRRATRIVMMRGTVHLVSAADCRALRPVLQPMLDRTLRGTFGKQIEGLDLEEVATAARTALDRETRTSGDLGRLLGRRWPDRDATVLVMVARAVLPLVQVPPRGIWGVGGTTSYRTAQHWLGAPLVARPSVDALVLRYLAAFGPATVMDVQAWSGLTRLGEVLDRLEPRLCTFVGEDGAMLFDLPDAPRPDPATPVPPRFVAEFDNVLLSHADRSRVVADEHRPALMSRNGLVPGTVLVDGFVSGTWRITRQRQHASLLVQPFRALPQRTRTTLESAGTRLLKFAADDARTSDVRFEQPG